MNLLKTLFGVEPPVPPSRVSFFIPELQYGQMRGWINEQDALALEEQRRTLPDSLATLLTGDKPYAWSLGDGISYEFTPLKNDVTLKVIHTLTEAEFELCFQCSPLSATPEKSQVFDPKTFRASSVLQGGVSGTVVNQSPFG